MIRTIASGIAALTLLSGILGQSTTAPPAFEVASIRASDPRSTEGTSVRGRKLTAPGGGFVATHTQLDFLIELAYGIQKVQLSGAPGWLNSARYDIAAKVEGSPNDDQLRLMVQSLLADRFKLAVHHETKEISVYELVLGKGGSKLKQAKPEEDVAFRALPSQGAGQAVASIEITGQNLPMSALVDMLTPRMGRPVLDRTGLTGGFDFKVLLTPDEANPNPFDPSTLITAFQEQLGLKLEARKGPVEIIVIDHVERPSEN